jgi:hypothetical protein
MTLAGAARGVYGEHLTSEGCLEDMVHIGDA